MKISITVSQWDMNMNLEITEEMLQEVTKEPEKIVEHIVPVKEEEKPRVPYDWFYKDVKNVEVEEEFPPVKQTRAERKALKREIFDDYRNGRIKGTVAAEKLKMRNASFYAAYSKYKNSWFTKI